MIKQTIICDRCGKEAWSKEEGTAKQPGIETLTIGRGKWGALDELVPHRHLCPDCKTAFHRFMENKESAMTDMEQAHKILKKYV